jgi:hypothetical protein
MFLVLNLLEEIMCKFLLKRPALSELFCLGTVLKCLLLPVDGVVNAGSETMRYNSYGFFVLKKLLYHKEFVSR